MKLGVFRCLPHSNANYIIILQHTVDCGVFNGSARAYILPAGARVLPEIYQHGKERDERGLRILL